MEQSNTGLDSVDISALTTDTTLKLMSSTVHQCFDGSPWKCTSSSDNTSPNLSVSPSVMPLTATSSRIPSTGSDSDRCVKFLKSLQLQANGVTTTVVSALKGHTVVTNAPGPTSIPSRVASTDKVYTRSDATSVTLLGAKRV